MNRVSAWWLRHRRPSMRRVYEQRLQEAEAQIRFVRAKTFDELDEPEKSADVLQFRRRG